MAGAAEGVLLDDRSIHPSATDGTIIRPRYRNLENGSDVLLAIYLTGLVKSSDPG